MSRKPRSITPTDPPESLKRSHETRKARSVQIVREAITRLQRNEKRVTLKAIVEAAKSASTTTQGGTRRDIAESTILRNPVCRQLYEDAVEHQVHRRTPKRRLKGALEDQPTSAETRRMHYLLRFSKTELAALLINTERVLKKSEDDNGILRDKLLLTELGPIE